MAPTPLLPEGVFSHNIYMTVSEEERGLPESISPNSCQLLPEGCGLWWQSCCPLKAGSEVEGLAFSRTPWLTGEWKKPVSLRASQRDLLIKAVSFPEARPSQRRAEAHLRDAQRTFIITSQVALVLRIKNRNYLSAVNVTFSSSMKFCGRAVEDEWKEGARSGLLPGWSSGPVPAALRPRRGLGRTRAALPGPGLDAAGRREPALQPPGQDCHRVVCNGVISYPDSICNLCLHENAVFPRR